MTPAILVVRKAGIAHEVLVYRHDPSAPSFGREAVEKLSLVESQVFKTLIADAEGVGLVCAVVPVSGMLDLKALADVVGARRARMADEGAAERSTGYKLGGISPLGQRRALVTVVDASALAYDRIYVSAGKRGVELALDPASLVRLTSATAAVIAKAP